MLRPIFGKSALLVIAAAAGLAGGGYFLLRPRPLAGPDIPVSPSGVAFHDEAAAAGITFRMAFLPAEQGEHFKVNLYDHGCGVAVADYNGDGKDDIYFLNQLGPNALYRNNGGGTFTDVTKQAGVALGDRICAAAAFGDYDNDGDQDLYVTSTRGGNVLFRNNGNGTFTDVTKQAGLTLVAHSQTASFFDYDGDGFLDLLVTNTARWTLNNYDTRSHYYRGPKDLWRMAASPREQNRLYHNKGDGTFEDVTAKSGLAGRGWGGDVAVFDYDGDGKPDVFVTNMFGTSQLYRNKGDGTFQDVTRKVLGRTSWGAIGSRAFDFNNDGRLDLLVVDMHSDMWLPTEIDPIHATAAYDLRRKYPHVAGPRYELVPELKETERHNADTFRIQYDAVLFGNTLYKQRASGKFAEVSDKAGVETWWPWGIATGDFDNDGHEDAFLPSGMGYPYGYWPNALLMNNGNETFTDRAAAAGIEPPPGGPYLPEPIGGKRAARSSRCAAVGDFDGDGRLDLVVNNFNGPAYYFRNHSPGRYYVAFRLRGTRSNRDAVGAVVRLYAGKEVLTRQVQAAGGYLSQSSKTLHFGLGPRTTIDRAEVRWPGGRVATIRNPALNTLHTVTEGRE